MTGNTNLKVLALYYVLEHENLTKENKLGLGNFITEANDNEVIHLLISGEAKRNVTTEEVDQLLEFMGESGYSFAQKVELFLSKGLIPDSFKPWAILGIAAIAAAAGMIAYRKKFSAASKSCANRKGPEKKACMNKFKIDAQKAKIMVMQKGLAACSKTKNPAKCKGKLQVRIAKEKAKLGQS